MPAPTTSTSTPAAGWAEVFMSMLPLSSPDRRGDLAVRRTVGRLYRPVSLTPADGHPKGEQDDDRGAQVVRPPCALCHGSGGPGSQGALLRPGLLRHGGRADLAPRLADGLPPRGDSRSRRLRGVQDPRSVGDRPADSRRGCAGLLQRLPPPRCPTRAGTGLAPRRLRLPLPRLVLRDGRAQHESDPGGGVLLREPPT